MKKSPGKWWTREWSHCYRLLGDIGMLHLRSGSHRRNHGSHCGLELCGRVWRGALSSHSEVRLKDGEFIYEFMTIHDTSFERDGSIMGEMKDEKITGTHEVSKLLLGSGLLESRARDALGPHEILVNGVLLQCHLDMYELEFEDVWGSLVGIDRYGAIPLYTGWLALTFKVPWGDVDGCGVWILMWLVSKRPIGIARVLGSTLKW